MWNVCFSERVHEHAKFPQKPAVMLFHLITWWGIVVRIDHPPLSRLLLPLLFNFSPSRLVQCLFFTLVFAHLSAFHMFNFFWCLPFPPSSSHLLQPPRPFSLSLFRPLLLSLSHSCILSLSVALSPVSVCISLSSSLQGWLPVIMAH